MASVRSLLGNLLAPLLFRNSTVRRIERLAPRFLRLELAGPDLVGQRFAPGDKVQLMLPDMVARTYSPFGYDATQGVFSVLVYVHGEGPGARWFEAAAEGAPLQVFGPRGSLALGALAGPVVFVGDETGLGAAQSLAEHRGPGAPGLARVFEATDAESTRTALRILDAPDAGRAPAAVVGRAPADGHQAALETAVRAALEAQPGATLVLTGQAQRIQALRAALKARPPAGAAAPAAQKTKAYWAPGKKGLD